MYVCMYVCMNEKNNINKEILALIWVGFVLTAPGISLIDGSNMGPEGHATWKFLPTII